MSSELAITRRILEALAYPRQVAMSDVDLSACPHSGVFAAMDEKCQRCTKNYECDWLNSTDQFNDLATKPIEFLYRALAFGIDYVAARKVLANHGDEDCDCNDCRWLHDARNIAHEYFEMSM